MTAFVAFLAVMTLRLDSAPRVLALTAGQGVASVTCRISGRTPGTELALVWFFRPTSSDSEEEIFRANRGGVTSQDPKLRPRYSTSHASEESFLLHILRPGAGEAGAYHCAGEEWLREEPEGWTRIGERRSGETQVTFTATDRTLSLSKRNVSSSFKQGEELVVPCPLEAEPGPSSLLSISWYLRGRGLLLRANQDGVTERSDSRLHMEVPRRGNYSLVLRSARPEDAGPYVCQAEEWRLQDGAWKMADRDQSGVLLVRVTAPDFLLRLNVSDSAVDLPTDSSLSLPCAVLAVSSAASLLAVSWWKAGGPGAPDTRLFAVNHTGEFLYPRERSERFQYERPEERTFRLTIHGGHVTDAGTYHCRVQEWLPHPRGAWEPIGEQRSGNTSVTVQSAGSPAPICTSLSLFRLLSAFSVLFAILVLALVAVTLWRCCAVGARRRFRGALWSSVNMKEVEKQDGGWTPRTDEKTTANEGAEPTAASN